jgi:hypothetical protein
MIFRVRDILPVIAPHLRGTGVKLDCDPSAVIDCLDAYNRINEILMNRHDWPGTEANVCFTAHRGCITLPEQFETIKALRVDGRATRILSDGFEYLESGPGTLDYNTPIEALQFLGNHFPTYRDLPRTLRVGCFSSHDENPGAMLRIYGKDAQGEDFYENGQPGLAIPINKGSADTQPYTTDREFSSIAAIAKPVTNGRVDVFAFDANLCRIFWLSRIQPHSTAPNLTRYFLSGIGCDEDMDVKAKVSLRYTELYSLEDISLIQHRECYRLMAQSIKAFDDSNGALGSEFQNRAVKMLKDRVAKLRDGQRHGLNVTCTRSALKRGRHYSLR